MTLPHRAPFGPAFARMGRLLHDRAGIRWLAHRVAPLPHDPEFLPDIAPLTPDQVQEVRYGRGRGSSNAKGCDR